MYDEAMKLIHTDPARGKAVMAKEFPSLSKEANDEVFETMRAVWTENGRMTEEQARRAMAYLTALGGLDVPGDFDVTPYFSNDMLPK